MRDARLAAVAAGALDNLTDFAAVLDGLGTVVYANPFALGLLGWTAPEIEGTSIADHLHPDDLLRALGVLGRMGDDDLVSLPVTPAFYRLRTKAGDWFRIELNATSTIDDELGPHIVVFGRYSGDHDLQDRVLELLTGGAPSHEAIALVPEFGLWRHDGMDYAVFCLDDHGEPFGSGSSALLSLGGIEDATTPWSEVARSGGELLAPLDELDASLAPWADRARALGFTHVWGMPVSDPLHDTHAVVAFARRDGHPDTEFHWYALDVMVKALRLILLWRHQVIRLQRAARIDPLTGLPNRTGFWAELDRLESALDDGFLAVLYVDLDGFKAVNDELGHAVGDAVLEQVAKRLHDAIRPGDHVARIGGDEFAVVAAGIADPETAGRLAERILAELAAPVVVGGDPLQIGASIGVTITQDRYDPDHLLERADRALYDAKASGRGRWSLAPTDG